MKSHPASGIFPLMMGVEFEEFCESIRENGERELIKLQGDRIVDGRNRYRACIAVGITPRCEQIEMDDEAVMGFVIDENLHRRHLTSSQRACVAVEFLELEKQFAKERMSEGGKGRQKVAYPNRDAGKSAERAAKKVGTNRTSVQDAAKLKAEDPEAFEAIAAGGKTVSQVKREKVEEQRAATRAADAKRIAEAPSLLEVVGKATFSTIVIDPPWDYKDEDQTDSGRTFPTYATISFEELKQQTAADGDIPISTLAASNSHLYLWITNRSLPKGFSLIEAWGFRYVTCLTWVKPSFGMGNYFRGQTEHILFGVKGSLSLLRKDAGTVLLAARPAGHSTKPDEFFSLVESCSPGPYVEIFSRRNRDGWSCWGSQP